MPFAGIVPVVKKVIMQKRPSYQLPLTKIQVEIPGKIITVISNSDAVQKNRGVSMLYILMGGCLLYTSLSKSVSSAERRQKLKIHVSFFRLIIKIT